MSRWKELPASLDRRVWQLVVQMRALKDHSGLSQSALAAKTSYSGSSWARYLNGKAVPPREAVEELARTCGADPGRLLALRDVAVEAWGSEGPEGAVGGEGAEGTDGGRDGPPRSPGVPRRRLLAGVVCAALLAVVAGLLIGRPWDGDGSSSEGRRDRQEQASQQGQQGDERGVFVFRPGKRHRCDISRKDGDLYAGYSLSTEVLLDTNSTSWDVVEAQCLLRHHGQDPGTVDGAYGERTKDAARRFQKAEHLAPDGIVGPDTWGALRR
ncbi:helix-turn-helix domain-containing protein [Streptomyces aurantiacus]|uniref:HTH cro/C1-type domain-containing protein n=1 Tax=Streptomyces aurantiacus JA 4570 TaxID=1286094 RepID=S3ZI86_9ACTN|nr:helix-turn-helix domain-containing protein [Streptomyces aurantiacus]EPH42399.1 hypothetical protein STRAU_4539 [Streptomyces aurantiacus JA 4570]